jgi:SOS-response transcriptional repressor LexA
MTTPLPAQPVLTDRQQKIVEFYCKTAEERREPPTLREVAAAVGLSSSGSAHYAVKQLRKMGLITDSAPDVSPEAVEARLSERQRKAMEFIRETTKARGYAPTVREIGKAVGLTSTSSVGHVLKQLRKKGLITEPEDRRSRAYRVVADDPAHGVPALRHAGCPLLDHEAEEGPGRSAVLRIVVEPAIRRAFLTGAHLVVEWLPVTDSDAGKPTDAALLGQVTAVCHPLTLTHALPRESAAADASLPP